MRTMVNVRNGGRGRLSGVIHGLVLLAVLLGAGSLAARIPTAVLAGILFTVGVAVIDYRGLRHVAKIPRVDAFIMILVFAVTVFVDLITAVGVGVVLASLLFMKHLSDVMAAHAKVAPLNEHLSYADERNLPPDLLEHVYIKHVDGPLFFGFASQFESLTRQVSSARVLVIRLAGVPYIDQSGLYVLEDACRDLKSQGVRVLLCELGDGPTRRLRAIGLIPGLVPEEDVFATFDECVQSLLAPAPQAPALAYDAVT